MKRFLFAAFALCLLATDVSAQCQSCGNGQSVSMSSCGSDGQAMQAVYGPFGRFRGWQAVSQANEFTSSDGKTYQLYNDGYYREKVAACVSTTGCDTCPACVAAKKTASNCPACDSLISTKGLREVTAPEGYSFFQDSAGTIYCLNKEAVKNSISLAASGKWIYQPAAQ